MINHGSALNPEDAAIDTKPRTALECRGFLERFRGSDAVQRSDRVLFFFVHETQPEVNTRQYYTDEHVLPQEPAR